MPIKTYRPAINEAMAQEMRRDSTVIVIGEDVAAPIEDLLARGHLTLYGNDEIRSGRKMGHLVRIKPL